MADYRFEKCFGEEKTIIKITPQMSLPVIDHGGHISTRSI